MTKKDLFSVHNKVVLVTGASGLIGNQICRAFLNAGAYVISGVHTAATMPALREALGRKYKSDRFLVCELDITNEESIAECLELAAGKFTKVDVLINNAAIDAKFDHKRVDDLSTCRFEDYPIELIETSLRVNVLGTIKMTQAFCRHVLPLAGGCIINVGSTYSLIAPNLGLYDFPASKVRYKPVDYVASKSFVPNFTRYIATLYGRDGIRCNAIAPHGVFDGHDDDFVDSFSKLSPLGRMCEKDELAAAFVFLASEGSTYITGITMLVDGGWTAW